MRYRTLRWKMLVVHPDGEHEWRLVDLVYDAGNGCIGVQLIGDGPLKGTLILVPEDALAQVKVNGVESERLIIQK